MPAYEVGDEWAQDEWAGTKSDPSEALCVSSSDKTKTFAKSKRFIECDTSSKYVKPKR